MRSDGDQSGVPELACPHCGSLIDPAAESCPRCGLAIEEMGPLPFKPPPTLGVRILAAVFLILSFLLPIAAMIWFIFQ